MTGESHYDPWAHAARIGIAVERHPLAAGMMGRYFHSRGLIVLRPGLTQVSERCVLAHEVVHAEYGDLDTEDEVRWARQEWRADRHAARRLIRSEDWRQAVRLHGHTRLVARELAVSPWVVRAYGRDLQSVSAAG